MKTEEEFSFHGSQAWNVAAAVCDLSQKGGGRVCEYMHARAIHNVLTQVRTVQKGGSNPPKPPENHTLSSGGLGEDLMGVSCKE